MATDFAARAGDTPIENCDTDDIAAQTPVSGDGVVKIVTVGHVDHGKSTLLGRLFHDTNSLPDGKIEAIQKACDAEGMPFEYAFLLDALLEEQEQNITIDTTQLPFRTEKRPYVLIDAPGHREFLKNMITGAARADAALLLIAATEGVREQTRRHGQLLALLNVREIVVLVNKMDLVGYDKWKFRALEAEYGAFLQTLGLRARRFIPISAREGDNIARQALTQMPWYDGPTVLEAIDEIPAPAPLADLPLRFPLQDIYRFDARRILAGRIESGTLRVGDKLTFSPGGKTSAVATIERWNGPTDRDFAVAGESVGITLAEQIFVERGHVAAHAEADGTSGVDSAAPSVTSRFTARVFWMGGRSLQAGARYRLKLATQESDAVVVSVGRVIDANTLGDAAPLLTGDEAQAVSIARDDVVDVTIETAKPLALDRYESIPSLGRFVLFDERRVAGGGIVLTTHDDNAPVAANRNGGGNLTWSDAPITANERAERNGYRGATVWLTGLSGAGKSAIANALARTLFERGMNAYVLDGDNLRHGLNADLGFSAEDRDENVRRVAQVAQLMADSGQIVITALISPLRAQREHARAIAESAGAPFIEVWVDTPLRVCEARDPKQLYAKARRGEIRDFTGIDAPYEAPVSPEITIRTENQSVDASAAQVLDILLARIRA